MLRRAWDQYEDDCIDMLRTKHPDVDIRHIKRLRDMNEWLEASGFLDAMEGLGKARRFHDFGVDAVGRHRESLDSFYFFQFKGRKKVDGGDLYTFVEFVDQILRLRGNGTFEAIVVSPVEVNRTSRISQNYKGIQHMVYPMRPSTSMAKSSIICTPVARDDQLEALRALESGKSGGVYAPCGWGKTLVMAMYCRLCMDTSKNVVVVAMTQALCAQLTTSIQGIIGGGHDICCLTSDIQVTALRETSGWSSPIVVVTYQTYRDYRDKLDRDVVLFDEAHHVQQTHLHHGAIQQVLFTATPRQLDGVEPLYVKHWADAAREGIILMPRIMVVVPKEGCIGEWGIVDLARFLCERAVNGSDRMVVFGNRLRDIEALGKELRGLSWGGAVNIVVIDGKLSQVKREQAIDEFKNAPTRQIQILLSVDVLSEGIDLVNCNSVVLVEPSTSITIRDIQRVSRCIRPDTRDPSKKPIVYVCKSGFDLPPIVVEMGRCFPSIVVHTTDTVVDAEEGVGVSTSTDIVALTAVDQDVLCRMECVGGDFRSFEWDDRSVPDILLDQRYIERLAPCLYRLLVNSNRPRTMVFTACGKDMGHITRAFGQGGDGVWGTSRQNTKMIRPGTWMVFTWKGMARKVGVVAEMIDGDSDTARVRWGDAKASYRRMYRVELLRDVIPRSLIRWNASQMQSYWSMGISNVEKDWLQNVYDPVMARSIEIEEQNFYVRQKRAAVDVGNPSGSLRRRVMMEKKEDTM